MAVARAARSRLRTAIGPPVSVATIAMESVSQNAYAPPASVTARSSSASMSRAAAVMQAAIGGKQYAPGILRRVRRGLGWVALPVDGDRLPSCRAPVRRRFISA